MINASLSVDPRLAVRGWRGGGLGLGCTVRACAKSRAILRTLRAPGEKVRQQVPDLL
jgi:hypothetical protein